MFVYRSSDNVPHVMMEQLASYQWVEMSSKSEKITDVVKVLTDLLESPTKESNAENLVTAASDLSPHLPTVDSAPAGHIQGHLEST